MGVGEKAPLLDGGDHGAKCGWGQSTVVIVASMLGTGILGLPFALKQSGLALGMIWLLIMLCLSIYSGLLLGKMFRAGNHCRTYAELTFEVFRIRFDEATSQTARMVIILIAYSYMFGVCCIFVTAMKISLQELLYNLYMPEITWLVLTVVFVAPFVQIRSLHDASGAMIVGVATIFAVNAIVIYHVLGRVFSDPMEAQEGAVAMWDLSSSPSGGAVTVMNGLTAIAFAFGGHVIFLEVMSEMKTPKHFPRSIYTSQLVMFANYVAVGVLGVLAFGSRVQSPVTVNLPNTQGIAMVANACLLVHVLVAYCIESYVVVIALDKMVSAQLPEIGGPLSRDRPRLRWGFLSVAVLLGSAFVSFCVPNFGDLMSLYSSVGIMTLSFAVPPLLWIVFNGPSMSKASLAVHTVLVMSALAVGMMGVWASADTIYGNLRMRLLV